MIFFKITFVLVCVVILTSINKKRKSIASFLLVMGVSALLVYEGNIIIGFLVMMLEILWVSFYRYHLLCSHEFGEIERKLWQLSIIKIIALLTVPLLLFVLFGQKLKDAPFNLSDVSSDEKIQVLLVIFVLMYILYSTSRRIKWK